MGRLRCQCRRKWNWRNGDHTKIEVHSQSLVLNVDCLAPVGAATGIKARDELAALLAQHCDAETETGSLHSDYCEYSIMR